MLNEMRLNTDSGVLVVSFGHSVGFEGVDSATSFDFWWFELWPAQMETIKKCPVWEGSPFTFGQLEKMIGDFDGNPIHQSIVLSVCDGEEVPIWADMEIPPNGTPLSQSLTI
jgi:hypothetical protein